LTAVRHFRKACFSTVCIALKSKPELKAVFCCLYLPLYKVGQKPSFVVIMLYQLTSRTFATG